MRLFLIAVALAVGGFAGLGPARAVPVMPGDLGPVTTIPTEFAFDQEFPGAPGFFSDHYSFNLTQGVLEATPNRAVSIEIILAKETVAGATKTYTGSITITPLPAGMLVLGPSVLGLGVMTWRSSQTRASS